MRYLFLAFYEGGKEGEREEKDEVFEGLEAIWQTVKHPKMTFVSKTPTCNFFVELMEYIYVQSSLKE